MKKKIIIFAGLVVLTIIIVFPGCALFEEEGSAVFWFNGNTAEKWRERGTTSMIFYVDGDPAGSASTSLFWNSAPECGASGSITVVKDLGTKTSKSFSYRVIDQKGSLCYSGDIEITANHCQKLQLTWYE